MRRLIIAVGFAAACVLGVWMRAPAASNYPPRTLHGQALNAAEAQVRSPGWESFATNRTGQAISDLNREGVMGRNPFFGTVPPGYPLSPSTTRSAGSKIWGVDISYWQGSVNFAQLSSAASFAIIRASFGAPDPGQTAAQYADARFNDNRAAAEQQGMEIGFYHYAYPDYGNSPAAEAKCFTDNVGRLKPGEFVVLDYERDWSGDAVGWCKAWLDDVQATVGVRPLLYIDLSRATTYDWSRVINGNYGLWLAERNNDRNADAPPTPWPFVAMRQYSKQESFPGIQGEVDDDVFYGSLDQLKAYGFRSWDWEGSIDSPVPGATIGVSDGISGWAWDERDPTHVNRVELFVNGQSIGDATYGEWRQDLGRSIAWSKPCDLTAWAGQTVTIKAVAYTDDGQNSGDRIMNTDVHVRVPLPAAPSGLAATASSSSIHLTWNDNSSNEDGFKIERGGSQIATVGSNVTKFDDTGLSASTWYEYRVRSYNAGGNSDYSNTAALTTLPAPPDAPTGLKTSAGSTTIVLSWTAHPGDSSYNIKRSTTSGAETTIKSGVTETSYTDTGLTNGDTYYYVVSAVNAGGEGPNSAEVSAEPTAAPGPALASISVAPTTVTGGMNATGTVALTLPAPAGGLAIALSANSGAVSVDSSVTLPGGASTATFKINTTPVNAPTPVAIHATLAGGSKSAVFTVEPPPPPPPATQHTFPAGMQMISAPYSFSANFSQLFGITNALAAVWQPAAGAYALYPAAPADMFHLGVGAWTYLKQSTTITAQGTPAPAGTNFTIPLAAGWNMIGCPFTTAVPWSGIGYTPHGGTRSTLSAEMTAGTVSPLYTYDGTANAYTAVAAGGSMNPWVGYWVYTDHSATLTIPAP